MKKNAYSLVEVLISGGILVVGIAGAALMINAISTQGNMDARVMQGINMQEQAARLWQLGLSEATITNILPAKCSPDAAPTNGTIRLTFNQTTNTNMSGLTNNLLPMDVLSPLQIVFPAGVEAAANGSTTTIYRTNNVNVVRPTRR